MAVIFSLGFYVAWICVLYWNWFKSAINEDCPHGNYTLVTHLMEPFRDMYQQAIILTIAQVIILVVVFGLGIGHFYWVYKNDLKFYLTDPYGKAI